jgi:hypothetical protein
LFHWLLLIAIVLSESMSHAVLTCILQCQTPAAPRFHRTSLLQDVVKAKETEIASMREQLRAMRRDKDRMKSDLKDAEAAAAFGRTAREQAIKSSRELADLHNRNEAESRKRRQLEMELERAKLAADRAARKNREPSLVQAL